ncbi:hypothetical protein FM037_11525 [Shewanella psychropiezotolerans]|uniref:Uncharacterized protein n=1 Tax=Shewanella psychropiezotolerans TaxID=2593655 RepID=A0ABX5WZ97_9GAMM|nr:hypothetical protein [Shewanella psychropiezotolerans]QDO83747.1 hypothetical protein FM037_11525 [Shewanella psychropiezotolerans]
MDNLSKKEAYLAMYAFLENMYKLTGSDDIGGLLGSMSLLQDGHTADPAAWQDWEDAIVKATSGTIDASLKIKR